MRKRVTWPEFYEINGVECCSFGQLARAMDMSRWQLEKLLDMLAHPEPAQVFRFDGHRGIHVPASLAKLALKVRDLGVVRLDYVEHIHNSPLDGCPEGTIVCGFDGHNPAVAVVGCNGDDKPVHSCPCPAPRWHQQYWCDKCAEAGKILLGHESCQPPTGAGLVLLQLGLAYPAYVPDKGECLIFREDPY